MGLRLKQQDQQVGQGMNATLTEEQKAAQQQNQDQTQQNPQVPQTSTSASTVQKAPTVKAMPKQQQAGTGTFANLKSYLQANQGNRLASAASQRIQNLATGAQKGITQAQTAFGKQVESGSLKNMSTAGQEAQNIVGAARGVTYQAPQSAPTQTPEQRQTVADQFQNSPQEQYFKNLLGDKYQDFINDRRTMVRTISSMDAIRDPNTGNVRPSITRTFGEDELYNKYGIDKNKIPTIIDNSQTTSPPQAAPEQTQPQYLSPEQQQRFAEIINAQYKGPESLRQAGLYEDIANQAKQADIAAKQAQRASTREDLLRDIFSQGRTYTTGQSKLDALLLNTSQQGIQKVQEEAQKAADIQNRLQAAENLTSNLASGRSSDINKIREAARSEFSKQRTEEETATEKRIDSLIKEPALDAEGKPIQKLDAEGKPMVDSQGNPIYMTQWDQLPEYYRSIIRNAPTINKQNLDKQIAQYTSENQAISDAQIKAAQKELYNAGRMYTNLPGEYTQFTPEQLAEKEARIKRAQENYNNLTTQKKAYDEGLAKIKNETNLNAINLSPEEAAVLGIRSGEGLYNLGQGLIEDVASDRSRLISKDEFARQQALAQLANQDISKALQKELLYTDANKAGTQTLASSLNTQAIRDKLDAEEKAFREAATADTLEGSGKKKVSRGGPTGTRTKTYYATQKGNVADMLRQAGYDVAADSVESAPESILSNQDALNNYLGATSTSRDDSGSMYAEGAARTAAGAATGAGIGAYFGAPWLGAGIGGAAGSLIGKNSTLSNIVGDLGGGRMSSSAMSKVGRGTAKELAMKDLYNKYQDYLEGKGFGNRLAVGSTPELNARSAALQELLRRKG